MFERGWIPAESTQSKSFLSRVIGVECSRRVVLAPRRSRLSGRDTFFVFIYNLIIVSNKNNNINL